VEFDFGGVVVDDEKAVVRVLEGGDVDVRYVDGDVDAGGGEVD
jgi:hypothetical protein